MRASWVVLVVLVVLVVVGPGCGLNPAPSPADKVGADQGPNQTGPAAFTVGAIGQIRKVDGRLSIVLDKKYEPGLLGLDGWSHIHVVWWFDQNDTPVKRSILQVHPRADAKNPLTGVFATRSPVRPNLIALSVCKIVAIKGNIIQIEAIDAFEGTPVIDIKPYTPGNDSVSNPKVPAWAGPK